MTPPVNPRTIGNMNGLWAVLLKIHLVGSSVILTGVVGWAAWVTRGQIKDDEFRGKGDRWTAADAEAQTKAIVGEVVLAIERKLHDHASAGGHSVMESRMNRVEARLDSTVQVEAEETEILRNMARDIHDYIEWVKESRQ